DRSVRELGADLGIERERDVERSRAQRGADPVGPHLLGQELDVGALSRERAADGRQRLEAGAPVVADAETADLTGAGTPRSADCDLGLGDRAPRAGQQGVPGLCEPDLSAAADEQARAELLLEPPHGQPYARVVEAPTTCCRG